METLKELLEREKRYCDDLVVGSEEYVKTVGRIMDLEKQLAEIEKGEREVELEIKQDNDAQKERKIGHAIEWTKIGANVLLPLIGYVVIVAAEKDITFTGALRDVTKSFLPKKMN